jgi:hypothetical protein
MRDVARTLLAIRARAHECGGWKPSDVEAVQIEGKGVALENEADVWLHELAAERALAHG